MKMTVRSAFAALSLFIALLVSAPHSQGHQQSASTVDTEIAHKVQELLSRKPEYKNVTFGVDDAVVLLAGSVELFSQRQDLASQVLKISKVSRVENLIVLTPAAIDDTVLYNRVRERLSRYEQVRFTAHQGLVILSGGVRNYFEYSRALNAAWGTPGVKEVQVGRLIVLQR